jgi:integrase
LLYGCGFRLSEVLNLKVRDIDLQQGVITVRLGKFGKDRLLPPAIELVDCLRRYAEELDKRTLARREDTPPGIARRFTISIDGRYFNAVSLMADAAKGPECMICATRLPFTAYCCGMRKALT